jgi:diguanylate cyclase (GGDEF)-like protein
VLKAPHRPVLVVISGNEMGARVRVDKNVLIGRDPSADLVLTDAGVSWQHARLEDRGDSWALVDLGSTNGTAVNGQKRAECVLAANDKLVFGRTLVRFEVQDALEQAYDEQVERMLTIDDLSGLFVRRKFDAELGLLLEAAKAKGSAVGLLVMDMDGIKKINDTHGHLFGAYTIGEAGHVIGRVIGPRGIASRFGGDEFSAAFPALDAAGTAALGEEIRAAIAEHHFEREGVRLAPGISVGAASFPENAPDAATLFQRADEALYRAKQGGRNRVSR